MFPILSQLAKQILSMPVSTVAVEQEFSSSGNTITDHRAQLSTHSLEVLVCYQDCLRVAHQRQDHTLEPTKHFMETSTEATGSSD
ncbi:hypothetical protein PTKIN_Ptkin08bG0123900 [Pterospermum kingtungense]